MTKIVSYDEYVRSPEWRIKAAAAKREAGACALCLSTKNLETHHRTYERLGRELPSDLVVLCGRCHRRHHGTFDECRERQLCLPWVNIDDPLAA